MESVRIFTPDYYAQLRDLESGSWWNAAMRDAAASLLEEAELPSRGTVIDVGCGSGQTLAWFSTLRPGWRDGGIDVAMDGLAAGRRFGVGTLALASALDLPYRDDEADLVISFDVLQHLPLEGGDRAALGEIVRVLRPGGWFLLRTNAQSIPKADDDPEHMFRKYGTEQLRTTLAAAGFEVKRLGRVNALLGLAEIPRELKANTHSGRGYHGLLARGGRQEGRADRLKRAWLRVETRAMLKGIRLPLGRTHLALCRKP